MSFQRDFMGKILRNKLKENGFHAYREIGECSDEIWLDIGCLFVVIYDKMIHTYRQKMVNNSYLKNEYLVFDTRTVKKILKEAEEWSGISKTLRKGSPSFQKDIILYQEP